MKYQRLQEAFISTPGHSKELVKYIHKVRDYLREYPRGGKEYDSREIMWTFPTFYFMPSVENVNEMLRFLDDLRPWSEAEEYRTDRVGSHAVRALIELLDDPPSTTSFSPEVWLPWREQIRNGGSFKFKDLEGRYTLEGKVETIVREPRKVTESKLGPNPKGGPINSSPEGSSSKSASDVSWWIYGGMIAVLVLSFGYLSRSRWAQKPR